MNNELFNVFAFISTASTCVIFWQPREKGVSVPVEVVKVSEKEFLFGASMPRFLGMRRFRFQSGGPWKTVTFAFTYFLCYCLFFFFNYYSIRVI